MSTSTEEIVYVSKNNDLLNGPIGPTIKNMTMPVVVGMLLLMTFGLVDTFFISLLGTEQLAAVSFTFPVTFTIISLNVGLGVGTSATVAKLLGAKQGDNAQIVGSGAITLAVLVGIIVTIVGWMSIEPIFKMLGANDEHIIYITEYMHVWYIASVFLAIPMVGNSVLRANGDTKTPSTIMAYGGLINAVLDPILIFGFGPIPALGIQGAAIATMVAWAVGSFHVIYLLAVKRNLMLPRPLKISELNVACKDILKIGIPAAGSNMLTPVANGVLTAIVAGYGTAAVATWGVGSRLEAIAAIVTLSLSMTLPPFISQNFGAQKMHRVKEAYLTTMKFIMVWQLLVFFVMWAASPLIAMAFAKDPEVERLIILFLSIVPLGYGLQGIVILTNSSFNAMHKPMAALVMSIVRLFVFLIPVSYLGSVVYDLTGIFWGGVVAYLGAATVSFIWFNRLLESEISQAKQQEAVANEGA